MQKRFLAVMNELQSTSRPNGLWLAHSDEPLVLQWLIDACRPIWQQQQQIIKRIELSSSKDWLDAIAQLNALSLFDEHHAIIVSGKHKPDDKTLAHLAQFAQSANDGQNSSHLLWLLPKQDKKSQHAKAFTLFANAGLIIDANVYTESDRQALLAWQADKLGLTLDTDAWQLLLSHTQNDLLTAHQNLWRLSLSGDLLITPQKLADGMTDGGLFTVFDLSDALLQQHLPQALKILQHLRDTDVAPSMVLWVIAKDIKILAQLQQGANPTTLGIWRDKIASYQRLARQYPPATLNLWLAYVYHIDKSIKGLGIDDGWRILHDLLWLICTGRTPIAIAN